MELEELDTKVRVYTKMVGSKEHQYWIIDPSEYSNLKETTLRRAANKYYCQKMSKDSAYKVLPLSFLSYDRRLNYPYQIVQRLYRALWEGNIFIEHLDEDNNPYTYDEDNDPYTYFTKVSILNYFGREYNLMVRLYPNMEVEREDYPDYKGIVDTTIYTVEAYIDEKYNYHAEDIMVEGAQTSKISFAQVCGCFPSIDPGILFQALQEGSFLSSTKEYDILGHLRDSKVVMDPFI